MEIEETMKGVHIEIERVDLPKGSEHQDANWRISLKDGVKTLVEAYGEIIMEAKERFISKAECLLDNMIENSIEIDLTSTKRSLE